jgi:hypothetical protein
LAFCSRHRSRPATVRSLRTTDRGPASEPGGVTDRENALGRGALAGASFRRRQIVGWRPGSDAGRSRLAAYPSWPSPAEYTPYQITYDLRRLKPGRRRPRERARARRARRRRSTLSAGRGRRPVEWRGRPSRGPNFGPDARASRLFRLGPLSPWRRTGRRWPPRESALA